MWTIAELKRELKLRSLKVSGIKSELVARLEQSDDSTNKI